MGTKTLLSHQLGNSAIEMEIHRLDSQVLQELAASAKKAESRRAKIVLMSLDGVSAKKIALDLSISRKCVWSWLSEFRKNGIKNLRQRPSPRSSIALKLPQELLDSSTCISTRKAAELLGVSQATVSRRFKNDLLVGRRGRIRQGAIRAKAQLPLLPEAQQSAEAVIGEMNLDKIVPKKFYQLVNEIRRPIFRILAQVLGGEKSSKVDKGHKKRRLRLFKSADLNIKAMETKLFALANATKGKKTLLIEPFALEMPPTKDDKTPAPRLGLVAILCVDGKYFPLSWVPIGKKHTGNSSTYLFKSKEIICSFESFCEQSVVMLPNFLSCIVDQSFFCGFHNLTVLIPQENTEVAVLAKDGEGRAKFKAVKCLDLTNHMKNEQYAKYYMDRPILKTVWTVKLGEANRMGLNVGSVSGLLECTCLLAGSTFKCLLIANRSQPVMMDDAAKLRYGALQGLFEIRQNFGLGKGSFSDESAWCRHKLMVSFAWFVAQQVGLAEVLVARRRKTVPTTQLEKAINCLVVENAGT